MPNGKKARTLAVTSQEKETRSTEVMFEARDLIRYHAFDRLSVCMRKTPNQRVKITKQIKEREKRTIDQEGFVKKSPCSHRQAICMVVNRS